MLNWAEMDIHRRKDDSQIIKQTSIAAVRLMSNVYPALDLPFFSLYSKYTTVNGTF